MSKERALLQTALGILEDYEWGYGGDHHKSPEASILNDIRKLLAQPEQEPKFNFDLERMKAAIESPISDVTVDDLAKQVKQEPVAWMQDSIELYVLEEKSAIRGYVIPLYTAPPKREPLSEKEIREGNQSMLNATRETFIAGVRFAEVMHGIGVDDE